MSYLSQPVCQGARSCRDVQYSSLGFPTHYFDDAIVGLSPCKGNRPWGWSLRILSSGHGEISSGKAVFGIPHTNNLLIFGPNASAPDDQT
jgi:hypothetical protein